MTSPLPPRSEGDVVDADEDLAELCRRMREADKTHCAILFCEDEVIIESSPAARAHLVAHDAALIGHEADPVCRDGDALRRRGSLRSALDDGLEHRLAVLHHDLEVDVRLVPFARSWLGGLARLAAILSKVMAAVDSLALRLASTYWP